MHTYSRVCSGVSDSILDCYKVTLYTYTRVCSGVSDSILDRYKVTLHTYTIALHIWRTLLRLISVFGPFSLSRFNSILLNVLRIWVWYTLLSPICVLLCWINTPWREVNLPINRYHCMEKLAWSKWLILTLDLVRNLRGTIGVTEGIQVESSLIGLYC